MNRLYGTDIIERLAFIIAAALLLATTGLAHANALDTDDIDVILEQIESVEAELGEFSSALVEPLVGLAQQHAASGADEPAQEALLRAQHLIHRSEGVHALRQLEIIEMKTDLYLTREEPHQADRQQKLAVYLAERNFGKASSEIVPALMKLERWYADTGQYGAARRTLDRVIDIIREEGGDADPRLIEPLMEGARVRRLARICCSYKLIEQARDVVEANPSLPSDEKAEVYAALGDAYLASSKSERAVDAYRLGWETLDTELAQSRFAEPAQIATAEDLERNERANTRVFRVDNDPFSFSRYREMSVEDQLNMETQPPQQFFLPLSDNNREFHIRESFSDDPTDKTRKVVGQPFQFILPQLQQIMPISAHTEAELANVQVDLEFTVLANGRVADVEIYGDAPAKLKRLMRRVLYKSHFRPRMIDGEPVATENYKLVQTFY